MQQNIDIQADTLAAKIKHYLITTMGKTSEDANDEEYYRAFSYALREEIMINWLATVRTLNNADNRTLYYLSMEYLPGRIFSNSITNVGATELVQAVTKKMNRSFSGTLYREPDPGLGNGGLGRLASCFLDSLATHHYPAQAYGLRYQYGIFEQHVVEGEQIEAPDCWLMGENPWEFRRDQRKQTVKFCGRITQGTNIHGDPISNLHDAEEVWALPYDVPIIGYDKNQHFSVVTLRLWTTKESPRNFELQRYNAGKLGQAAENTTLTDVLYPADYHDMGRRIRLKQEFLLVSASLQDILRHYLRHHTSFQEFAEKVRIQINDTHPSLVIPELIRLLIKKYDLPWRKAVDYTRECTGYTNHTILQEALEQWDQGLLQYLLPRQYTIIERLNQELCDSVRSQFPGDEERIQRMSILENGMVRMANLSIYGSHKVNGVAALHSKIIQDKVFKDFYEMTPEKFINVTNGVTQRRWLLHANPLLSEFITERIGDGWIHDFSEIKQLASFADDEKSQEEMMQIKRKNKENLIHFLQKKPMDEEHSLEIASLAPVISFDSIFDTQIKRFHEYKRQLMNALHVIMLYNEIQKNPKHDRVKRTVIFSGKAAPGYQMAKHIIRLIFAIARKVNRDFSIQNHLKVLFIENYNVSNAEKIIPASDLSEQISTAGLEASGTGNMKLSINGSLTIGTQDGANIEMNEEVGDKWWPFSFGATAEEIAQMEADQTYRPYEICNENPAIQEAVEMLRDDSLAQNGAEKEAFQSIYAHLMSGQEGAPDRYFVLKDLQAYADAQKKVEELYKNQNEWTKYVIHNIAGMGKFSTDRSIFQYAERIWGLNPCPPDLVILDKVRQEYSEHDKCRIL